MTTPTMYTSRGHRELGLVHLPTDIAEPHIADAFDRVQRMDDAYFKARDARDAADAAVTTSRNADTAEIADILFERDDFEPEPGAREAASRVELVKAQALLDGVVEARRRAYRDLRVAIADHGAEWRAELRKTVDAAVQTLTTSLRSAERAAAGLEASVGPLKLIAANEELAAESPGALASMASPAGRYVIALAPAIESLYAALSAVADEVKGL